MSTKVLSKVGDEDSHMVREKDKSHGCKECFKWEWFERQVSIDSKLDLKKKLGDCFEKIDSPGVVICVVCGNKTVNYSNRGVVALVDHVKSAKHRKLVLSSEKTPAISEHFGKVCYEQHCVTCY